MAGGIDEATGAQRMGHTREVMMADYVKVNQRSGDSLRRGRWRPDSWSKGSRAQNYSPAGRKINDHPQDPLYRIPDRPRSRQRAGRVERACVLRQRGSDFFAPRRAVLLGRSSSITHSPRPRRNRVSPAP